MYQRRTVLDRSEIVNGRFAECHDIAYQVVVRNSEQMASFRHKVVDGPFCQTIPDGTDPVRLGEKLKV